MRTCQQKQENAIPCEYGYLERLCVSVVVDIGKDDSFTLKEDVRVMWGKELWAPFQPVFA